MAQVVTKGARLGARYTNGRRMTWMKRLAHRAERRIGREFLARVAVGQLDDHLPYPTKVRVTGWHTSLAESPRRGLRCL